MSSSNHPNSGRPPVQSQSQSGQGQRQGGQGQATQQQTQAAINNTANANNNSNNNNSSNNNVNNNNNNKKRKRGEDQTVSNLRFQWHLYISKILSCKLLTAQKDVPREKIVNSIKEKCQEVIEGREELKKTVGRMESVIRGKEEEMRGLYLDKASSGSIGRGKRRRVRVQNLQAQTQTQIPK
eukprot:936279_1